MQDERYSVLSTRIDDFDKASGVLIVDRAMYEPRPALATAVTRKDDLLTRREQVRLDKLLKHDAQVAARRHAEAASARQLATSATRQTASSADPTASAP